jgi:hypothetical protein
VEKTAYKWQYLLTYLAQGRGLIFKVSWIKLLYVQRAQILYFNRMDFKLKLQPRITSDGNNNGNLNDGNSMPFRETRCQLPAKNWSPGRLEIFYDL